MRMWLWYLSWIVIGLGVLFYVAWGIYYNVWTDVGPYSVSAPMIVFGILGAILAKLDDEEDSQ